MWFHPTKPGKYHLFCAEYVATKHSGMIGWVYVMEPQDYESWLSGGAGEGSLAARGDKLFQDLACTNCHKADGSGRGPVCKECTGRPWSSKAARRSSPTTIMCGSRFSAAGQNCEGLQPVMRRSRDW